MYNHFSSSRRWCYIITSVVGGEHKHYVVYRVVDSNSLHNVNKIVNSGYDGYSVSLDVDKHDLYEPFTVSDTGLGYYLSLQGIDTNTLYVVIDRGDYNK